MKKSKLFNKIIYVFHQRASVSHDSVRMCWPIQSFFRLSTPGNEKSPKNNIYLRFTFFFFFSFFPFSFSRSTFAGDIIIKEGTIGSKMYFIQEGIVDIVMANGEVSMRETIMTFISFVHSW